MQTNQNGIETPTNSDPYALTEHLAGMADKSNVVIKVANQAARDALVKTDGMVVVRLDLPRRPMEVWDGARWNRQANFEIQGQNPAAVQFKFGTITASSDANGAAALTFDAPFPNAIYGTVVTQAKAENIGAVVLQYDEFLSTKSRAAFFVYDMAGGLVTNLANFRATYVAFGS